MLKKLFDYFAHGIWEPATGVGARVVKYVLRRFVVAGRVFMRERMNMRAAALTYSLLLAIVPVLAIVFAVAKGFGLAEYIEDRIMVAFAQQPGVAETLMGFVEQYLEHSRGGVVLGFGILLLLWSVFSLADTVEGTFNQIWRVRRDRSIARKVSDYSAATLLLPIFLVLSSGLSIFLSSFAEGFSDVFLLHKGMRVALEFVPYVLMIVFCTLVFLLVPNAKVRWRSALVAGIPVGIVMQLLLYLYIDSQALITGYSAVYGSFAALPLLMLWIRIAWEVMLFGSCLCYVDQNMEHFFYGEDAPELSRLESDLLALRLTGFVCRKLKNGEEAPSFIELVEAVKAPEPVVWNVVGRLHMAGILEEAVPSVAKDDTAHYYVLLSLESLTVGEVLRRMDFLGHREDVTVEFAQSDYYKYRLATYEGNFADTKVWEMDEEKMNEKC